MNKSMAIKIVIGIVIALLIGIVVFVIYKTKVRDNIDDSGKYSDELLKLVMKDRTYDKLTKIQYSNSGNSNGNVYTVTLYVDEKKLVEEKKDYISDPLHIREYSITDQDIELLLNEIEEYNFPEWKDLKTNYDEIALDAATAGVNFFYDNSGTGKSRLEVYHVDFNMKMPEDGREALSEFVACLRSPMLESNKIREYDEGEEIEVPQTEPQPETQPEQQDVPEIINSFDVSSIQGN